MSQAENLPEKIHGLLVARLAEKYEIPAEAFLGGLRDTVFHPGKDKQGHPLAPFSNEELMVALVLADQYDLNPFAKQIYITRAKGRLLVIVPVDGWAAIVNRLGPYDGCEFVYGDDGDRGAYIDCTMWHKDRAKPTTVREYMNECRREVKHKDGNPVKDAPWNTHPLRMLRHKAFIQCARVSFGLTGMMDEDEADGLGARVPEYRVTDSNTALPAAEAPRSRAAPREVTPTKKIRRRRSRKAEEPEVRGPSQARVPVDQPGEVEEVGGVQVDGEPPPAQTELHEGPPAQAERPVEPTETVVASGPLLTPAQYVNEINKIGIGHDFAAAEWSEVNAAAGVDQIVIDCDIGRLEAALRKAEEIAAARRE